MSPDQVMQSLKFVYKFRYSDIFVNWFCNSYQATKDRPLLYKVDHYTDNYQNSILYYSITNWNKLVDANIVTFNEKLTYNMFIDGVTEYLLRFRSKISLE